MLNWTWIGAGVLLTMGQSFAEPIDFATATTLSWTSDGPQLQDSPPATGNGTPRIRTPSQDRITLDNTGKSGWYIAPPPDVPHAAIN